MNSDKSEFNYGKEKFFEYVVNNDILLDALEISEKARKILYINNKVAISDIVLISNEDICKFNAVDKETAVEIIKCKNKYLSMHKDAIIKYATKNKEIFDSSKTTPVEDFLIENDVILSYTSNESNVIIPSGIKGIGERSFWGCLSLSTIFVPDGIKNIGSFAFSGCENLVSVTISEGIEKIQEGTFYDCKSLTSFVIPSSVTSIDGYSFENCAALETIILSNNITEIGYHAFEGCEKLNICTPIGSYAEKYAIKNNIRYTNK